jgi:hypothetical protein
MIEREGAGTALLCQAALLLLGRDRAAWPAPHPRASVVAHWRSIGGLNTDDGDVAAVLERHLLYCDRREGVDVPVVAHARQVLQQVIVDPSARAPPVVLEPNEQDAGRAAVR